MDLANLAGAESALVRVTASDGFNSASDVSDAPFSVPAKGPDIYLASPQEGDQYYLDAPVVLQAMGTDRQDGPTQDKSFTWKSDRDGDLGNGHELIIYSLSQGDHTITLTGVNSAGMRATQVVHIHIVARPGASGPYTRSPIPGVPLGIYNRDKLIVGLVLGVLLLAGVTAFTIGLVRWKKR